MLGVKAGDTIDFTYTNWKSETSRRKAIVEEFVYGSNEWHKETQFFIRAFDLDKASIRLFATKDITNLEVNKNRTYSKDF